MKNALWYVLAGLCLAGQAALGQLVPVPHVDTFTGTFTTSVPVVTIPGPHGGGFTVQLTYSSDVKAEEEASIVGYGWSLNIPTITRAKMGFPDDVKEGEVTYQKKNSYRSTTISARGAQEFIAIDETEVRPPLAPMDDASGGSLGLAVCATCSDGTGLDIFATASGSLGISQPGLGNPGIGAAVNTKGMFAGTFSSSIEAFRLSSNVYSYNPNSRISPTPFGSYPVTGSVLSGTGTIRWGAPMKGFEGGIGYTSLSINEQAERKQKFSGYLYTPMAGMDETKKNVAMDYLVERDRPVGIDDPTPLPMPIPAPDRFVVSAPEISGTFRVHHPLPLRLRPAESQSVISQSVISGKLTGPNLGGGVGLAVPMPAERTTTYGDIRNDDYMAVGGASHQTQGTSTQFRLNAEWLKAGVPQPPVFRYENDAADVVRYTASDVPMANWMVTTNGISQEHYHPANIQGLIRTNRNIAWRTLGERRIQPTTLYESGAQMEIPDIAHDTTVKERITEFTITSESGNEYNFSVPLWSTEEVSRTIINKDMKLDIPTCRVFYKNGGGINENPNRRGYIDYTTHRAEYASAWMIRSITAPNYVDVDNNGPSSSDNGAWTLFTYQKPIPYNWRSPHNGFLVERGDVDDREDDRLSYSYGTQYTRTVRTIETASHIAEFVMNTTDTSTYPKRKDAYPRWSTDEKAQASPSGHTEGNPSEYLAMVRLYVKLPISGRRLLQTVHFQYDYSLMPGNPSSEAGAGKLTLRRVWVENRDVKDSKVNPLTFNYESPVDTASTLLATRYPSSFPTPGATAQNPSFDANNVDAWGYQQGTQPLDTTESGLETMRYSPRQAWQQPVNDAAAWRLKSMDLPTGGSINVQYESRTYRYVQDKPAMFLADVIGSPSEETFLVDIRTLGAPSDIIAARNYASLVTERFVNRGEPVYYDFTYSNPGCLLGAPGTDHAKGYGVLTECSIADSTHPYIMAVKFGSSPTYSTPKTRDNIDESIRHLPLRTATRLWNVYGKGRCWCDGDADVFTTSSMLVAGALEFVQSAATTVSFPSNFPFDNTKSQLRLPVYGDKTGGGVRVKRLMMVSAEGSLEEGDAAAVGTEYLYDEALPNGRRVSTGVALNEPWQMRTENAIVGIDQSEWGAVADHVFDMKDVWRSEGPLGMTIMPGGSVGYGKVTARGINRNANAMPHSVYTYLTAKDIPPVTTTMERISTEKKSFNDDQYGPVSVSTLNLRLAQSFMIEHRPYHGLLSLAETFAPPTASGATALLQSTKYDYAAPDEQVLLYDTLTRALRYTRFGDYEDLVFEGRRVKEDMSMFSFDFSVEQNPVFPSFAIGFSPSYVTIDHEIRTYAATKILARTPILRRVISFDRGATDTVETFAYDRVTRLPAIYKGKDIYYGSTSTKSVPSGNHNGNVHTVSMPAHRVYPHMGQKSPGYRYVFGMLGRTVPGIGVPLVTTYPVLIPPTLPPVFLTGVKFSILGPADSTSRIAYLRSMFSVGDVLCHRMRNPTTGVMSKDSSYYTVTAVADSARGVFCSLALISPPPDSVPKVDGGMPMFTRVRSGKTNQLTSVAGSVALYGVDDSHILQRARELRDLDDIARHFTLGTRTDNRYEPFKHFSPDYEYRAFQFKTPAKKLDSSNWNRHDSCDASVSRYANAQLTKSVVGSSLMTVLMGIADRDTVVCPCITSWKDCTDPWLVLSGGILARKTYKDWDRWSRFRASDKGDLTIATYAIPATVAVDSLTFHDGNFGCVPNLITPFALPETCGTGSPANSKVLEMSAVTYALRDPSVFSGVPRTRKYEPVVTWSYGTSDIIDGSSGSIGSYARTGAYPVSGSTPAMWSLWNVATTALTTDAGILAAMPSDTNHQGWMRSAFVSKRSPDAIPVEIVGSRGDTSSLQLTTLPFPIPVAAFANRQYGEGYSKDFETGVGGVAKPHTGSFARRLYGTGGNLTETISRYAVPTNTPPGSRPARIQFWIRPYDSLSTVEIRNHLTVASIKVTADDSVACVHGWRLYDIVRPYSAVGTQVVFTADASMDFLLDDVSVSDVVGGKSMVVYNSDLMPIAVLGTEHLPMRAVYDDRGMLVKTMAATEYGWLAEAYSDGHLPEWARTESLQRGGTNYEAMMMAMPFDPLRDVYNGGHKMRMPRLEPQKAQAKGTLLDMKMNTEGIKAESPLQKLIPTVNPNKNEKPEVQR